MFDSNYLHRLESSGLLSHDVSLKRYAVIVIIHYLDIAEGYCNSTR